MKPGTKISKKCPACHTFLNAHCANEQCHWVVCPKCHCFGPLNKMLVYLKGRKKAKDS